MTHQTLRIRPREDFTFERFRVGTNESLIDQLKSSQDVWLYGDHSVGKTHLSHAVLETTSDSQLVSDPSYDLQGLDQFSLVVVDDIGRWLGSVTLEAQLMGILERLRAQGGRMVVTANSNANETKFALPDLGSRMRSFLRIQVFPLPEGDRVSLLRELAADRGMDVSQEVGDFLMARISRSQHELLSTLERLDDASIVQQRRITIPFVKQTLQI